MRRLELVMSAIPMASGSPGSGSGGPTDRYDAVIGKLEQGLQTKKFDLSRDEARLMVTALDLYNVRRTDGVGQAWDEEAEQLFQELQTLFAKTYGEGLYAA